MRLGHAERDTDTDRPRTDAEPLKDLATVVLRLAEQVEDLAVLTESAQAQALPLADEQRRARPADAPALGGAAVDPDRPDPRPLPAAGAGGPRRGAGRGAAVEVVMIGEETGLDRAVQDKAFEPLLHVVRNAVGHGIEPPEERLSGGQARRRAA